MDRRWLITLVCAFGAAGCMLAIAGGAVFGPAGVLPAALLIGGAVSPLYALIIAHTNDFLETDDMASGAAGLLFLNGIGAVGGPLAVGSLMDRVGAGGFFLFIGLMMGTLGVYSLYRMTVRAAVPAEETNPHAAILPSATGVALEITQGVVADLAASHQAEAEEDDVEGDMRSGVEPA